MFDQLNKIIEKLFLLGCNDWMIFMICDWLKKIVVNINSLGEISAETFGIKGSKCLTTLDRLLKDIARETHTEKKPDYFDEGVSVDKSIKVKNSWLE